MLGKILTITKNSAIVEVNKEAIGIKDLINLHVVFEDDNKKILGEIDSIEQDSLKISFLGELNDNDFIGGLIKKPSMDAKIRIINQDELKIISKLVGIYCDNAIEAAKETKKKIVLIEIYEINNIANIVISNTCKENKLLVNRYDKGV